jgi:hypothetical protein
MEDVRLTIVYQKHTKTIFLESITNDSILNAFCTLLSDYTILLHKKQHDLFMHELLFGHYERVIDALNLSVSCIRKTTDINETTNRIKRRCHYVLAVFDQKGNLIYLSEKQRNKVTKERLTKLNMFYDLGE